MNNIDKDQYLAYIKDLEYKIQWLLDNYIECEEGKFCFPDGKMWEVSKRKKEEGKDNG